MLMFMTHGCKWAEYKYSLAKRPFERDTKPSVSTRGGIL